ncbi:MFS transporter [Cohnella thermotolerans]|uniref:MFS transporter n=1 Tax=Cohnella thermotolerans TaxID=329858 RepID=UPI0003FFB26E|nr:MFS transporter [Cohnella thermotolerans]
MRPTELSIRSARRRTGVRDGFWIRLSILFAIEFVRGAFVVSFMPSYAGDRLQFSLSAIGAAVSVHYLADSVCKLAIGYALDRLPARLVLVAGWMLTAAGLGLFVEARDPWALYAASAMIGIGGSPMWLVSIAQVGKARRAERMGTLYLFWMAGLGLGPVMINFALDRGYSFAFAILLGVTAVACFVSLLVRTNPAAEAAASPTWKEQGKELVGRIRRMGVLFVIILVQTTAGSMLMPLLSPFAAHHFGFSHSQLSAVLVTGGAAAVGLMIPMGKLTDAHGGRTFLIGGFGLFALALFGIVHAQTFLQAELLAIVLGGAYAALLPAWNAMLADHVPEQSQGTGWGLISAIEGAGVMAGPVLGGWLAERYGDTVPFLLCAFLFASLFGYFLLFRRRETAVRLPRRENSG